MALPDNQESISTEFTEQANKESEHVKEKDDTKLIEELTAEKEKNKGLYDKYVRLQAEFENFKKRVERDKCEFYKYALEKLIKDILPALDNFELAIKSANISKDFESFSEGVQLIYTQLKDILEKEGLNYECSVGEIFDPSKHEAVMLIESKDHKKNQIIEELKKGYFLKDRLIRPAMVTVAKKPEYKNIESSGKNKTENQE